MSPVFDSTALDWSAGYDALVCGASFATEPRVVSDDDVRAFAELTGDHHPLHTDDDWATQSEFGRRIAHGLLVVSCAAGLVPFDPRRVMALRSLREATFKRPVSIGDAIAVHGHVDSLRPLAPDVGLVGLTWSVVDGDDRLVCRARVEVLWRRDTA